MAGVTGIGGAFLRAANPETLYAWHEKHLNLKRREGSCSFDASEQRARVAVAFFSQDADYFPPAAIGNVELSGGQSRCPARSFNRRNSRRERCEFGSFGWITNPEGNRVELWQPV